MWSTGSSLLDLFVLVSCGTLAVTSAIANLVQLQQSDCKTLCCCFLCCPCSDINTSNVLLGAPLTTAAGEQPCTPNTHSSKHVWHHRAMLGDPGSSFCKGLAEKALHSGFGTRCLMPPDLLDGPQQELSDAAVIYFLGELYAEMR